MTSRTAPSGTARSSLRRWASSAEDSRGSTAADRSATTSVGPTCVCIAATTPSVSGLRRPAREPRHRSGGSIVSLSSGPGERANAQIKSWRVLLQDPQLSQPCDSARCGSVRPDLAVHAHHRGPADLRLRSAGTTRSGSDRPAGESDMSRPPNERSGPVERGCGPRWALFYAWCASRRP